MLDPAGYGAVTINHAISIVNDGVGVAAIGTSSGNAITINAGATDSVHLRGLTLTGLGSGANGILFNTGGNLEIENCVVRNFANAGINISPSTSSSFSVSNTIASDNGNDAAGVFVQPSGSAVVSGVLSKVTMNNNGGGITVNGAGTTGASLNVTIVDSEASNNASGFSTGVFVYSNASTAATAVMLRDVVVSNNRVGLHADLNGILRVAHSVVTGNNTGVLTGTGAIKSYGNDMNGNTNNNFGLLTTIPTH